MHHDAIRRTLLQRAGGTPDAHAIAEATLNTWHQVAARLTPVIGVRGVDVLFSRSLHLTSSDFPWLAIAGEHEDSAAQLASLKAPLPPPQHPIPPHRQPPTAFMNCFIAPHTVRMHGVSP